MERIRVTEDELKAAWRASRTPDGGRPSAPLDDAALDELLALAEGSGDDDVRLARLEAVLRDPVRAEAFQWFVAARTAAMRAAGAEARSVQPADAEDTPSSPRPAGAERTAAATRPAARTVAASSARRWLPLAAALTVMLGAGLWSLRDRGGVDAPLMRGGGEGTVRIEDAQVRWTAVPGADRYAIELLTADGRTLRRDTVTTTTWPLPVAPGDSLDGDLPSHVLIVALLANGRQGEPRLAPIRGR